MTYFSTFALSLGVLLAGAMVMSAWIARTAAAPFALKLVIPALLVFLACYTPLKVNSLLGFPVVASNESLPARGQLIGFVAHDAQGRVDLWLRSEDEPRAFNIPLTKQMKELLRMAQNAMQHGKSVMLVKGGKGKGGGQGGKNGSGKGQGDQFGIGDDPHDFTLDFTDDLPPKESP